MGNLLELVTAFEPCNNQELSDKAEIINYINQYPNDILLRRNEVAHITSSGFVMNDKLDKVLMVHHNIRDVWSWTGGHADGNEDLLYVAIKEAKEETGLKNIRPLTNNIASLDIGYVKEHKRKNKIVGAHKHLSIAYILIASENDKLEIKEDENSEVRWFGLDIINKDNFDDFDFNLYGKLIDKATRWNND